MDFNRFFLYTSLAIVTYLLLLAWQQDYPPLVDDGSALSSEAIAEVPLIPQGIDAAPATDVPSDLPKQNTAAGQDTPTIVQQVTSKPTSRAMHTINSRATFLRRQQSFCRITESFLCTWNHF